MLKGKHLTYVTTSDQETMRLGKRLGAVLAEGDVIALIGELGSGKTWFTKGVAFGLGVSPDTVITSPSFTLVNEYEARYTFYHMDFYRLQGPSEISSAGLEEYFYNGGVIALEWADRWPEILPEKTVTVQFSIIDDYKRKITFSGQHPRAREIIEQLRDRSAVPLAGGGKKWSLPRLS